MHEEWIHESVYKYDIQWYLTLNEKNEQQISSWYDGWMNTWIDINKCYNFVDFQNSTHTATNKLIFPN